MAKLDKFLEMMAQRQVKRAVLIGDKPFQIILNGQKVEGSVLPTEQLRQALLEVAPEHLRSEVEEGGSLQFCYNSPQGPCDVEAETFFGTIQIKLALGKAEPVVPSSYASSPQVQSVAESPIAVVSQGIQPPALFGVKLSMVDQIMDSSEQALVAGKIKEDTQYLIIVIPLWFNIITQYLVFTDTRILVATKTLWRGVTEVVPIPYSDVYSVVVTIKKKKFLLISAAAANSKIIVRLNSGDLLDFPIIDHTFVAAVAERIKHVVKLTVEP